jgi:hypothetical protein
VLASSGNERELLCSSPNRARHLCSSTHLLAPASHRLPVTRAAYASPLLGLALRLWLHGSARLSYLRVCPCVCPAKGVAQVCADRKEVTPAAPPNTCCSRPPSRCDFPSQRVPTILLLHTPVLVGRPAELLRWAAILNTRATCNLLTTLLYFE